MKKMKKMIACLLAAGLVTSGISGTDITASAKKKIVLNKKKLVLTVGKKADLRLKGAKAKKVKWKSSKKKVVSVTSKGIVKGKKAGKAVVSAKYGGKTYKCKVTVKTGRQKQTATGNKVDWKAVATQMNTLSEYIMANGEETDETIQIRKTSEEQGEKTTLSVIYDSDNGVIQFTKTVEIESGDGYVISLSISEDEPQTATAECQITENGETYIGSTELDTQKYSSDEESAGFDFASQISGLTEGDDENVQEDDSDAQEDEDSDSSLADSLDQEATDYLNAAMGDWDDYLAETASGVKMSSLGFVGFDF